MSPADGKNGVASLAARQPGDTLGPRAERRIQLILDSAREVFLRLGYAGTTIDEIAREADISRASIYTYFTSKREIFFALGAAASETNPSLSLIGAMTAPLDFEQCLEFIEGWFAHHDKSAGFSMVWREAAGEDAEMLRVGRKKYLQIAERLGRQLGNLSPAPLDNPTALGIACLTQWEGAWRCSLYLDKNLLQDVKALLAKQLLATLSSVD